MDCLGLPPDDTDDEIREEYIGRHRVHFLGHHLVVPVLKVMTINDDADENHEGGHHHPNDDSDHLDDFMTRSRIH